MLNTNCDILLFHITFLKYLCDIDTKTTNNIKFIPPLPYNHITSPPKAALTARSQHPNNTIHDITYTSDNQSLPLPPALKHISTSPHMGGLGGLFLLLPRQHHHS